MFFILGGGLAEFKQLCFSRPRQSVPEIRPHSWHLAKLSELPGATPDTPPAMQLHPAPFTVPWHSGGDNSDPSMQWSQLSRHCSTDRSSSLGSMESLDTRSQGYYESQLSPVDPAIFNNKRDSAYSSFSASSNTSDCTVSLRPGEASSMDNLVHGLGRSQLPDGGSADTCESPSHPSWSKLPSSSCSFEEQVNPGAFPESPQPSVHKDGFQVTRGCLGSKENCCGSLPAGVRNKSSCQGEDPSEVKGLSRCRCYPGGNARCEGKGMEQYYTLSSQQEPCYGCTKGRNSSLSNCLASTEASSPAPSPSICDAAPMGTTEAPAPQLLPPLSQNRAEAHRHSVPEKLLSSQLQQLELSSSVSCRTPSPCSQRSGSPRDELEVHMDGVPSLGSLDRSQCSTPGSVGAFEQEQLPHGEPFQHTYGRSLSMPGEAAVSSLIGGSCPRLSMAASVDTLLEETQADGSQVAPPKPGSSRQRRSAKARRCSDRFATNLRNEIQRKKAQLQRSQGPGAPLYGDQTVEEEEDSVEDKESPEVQVRSLPSPNIPPSSRRLPIPESQPHSPSCPSRSRTLVPQCPTLSRSGCNQTVDEQNQSGKVRRWRWTPEHKLQPQMEPERQANVVSQPGGGKATVSRPSSRTDDCEILPFAERMKFFEETSRSLSVSSLPSLTSCGKRQENLTQVKQSGDASGASQRRYSYQGYVQCPPQTRRPSESSSREREHPRPTAVTKQDFRPQRHVQSNGPPPMEHRDGTDPPSSFQATTGNESGDHRLHYFGSSRRSRTPTEAHPVQEREQPQLNRKLSLTERDRARRRRDFQPAEGSVQQDHGSCWGNSGVAHTLSTYGSPEPLEQCPQRSRALSESEVRLDDQRLRANPAAFSGSAPSEAEESSRIPRRKCPPPPRPPPPKWGEFHRRRASQQNLFSTPSPTSREALAPWGSPDSLFRPSSDFNVTRHRSQSLPLGAEPENFQHYGQERSAARFGSAFTRTLFQPVAAPPREPDASFRHPDPNGVPSPGMSGDSGTAGLAMQDRPALLKPISSKQHCAAEWDRGVPQGGAREPNAPAMDNSCHQGAHSPQLYMAVNSVAWQRRGSTSPHARDPEPRAVWQEDSRPFETDIDECQDDFGADEAEARTQVEVHGFARPATVLETDIDTVPEAEPRPQHRSLAETLLAAEAEAQSRANLLEELLPPGGEGDAGMETWRGGRLELSVDSLERRARLELAGTRGPGSSRSSCCYPAAVLGTGSGGKEEEEELSYKRQLMERLQRKLSVLREAQRGLQEEVRANARLGDEVEALVLAVCRPCEVDKFRMLVGDLDKVVSLLLSLSGRLLRVESALDCLGPDAGHHERHPLLDKKQLLLRQLGEARELKEHVDRREEAVCRVLGRCLTPEQLRDYGHFVKMKAALLVEQRQLEDKIRLGEEQLRALQDSLDPTFGVFLDCGRS